MRLECFFRPRKVVVIFDDLFFACSSRSVSAAVVGAVNDGSVRDVYITLISAFLRVP